MQRTHAKAGSNAPYSIAAMLSIFLLVGVIIYKGDDGPLSAGINPLAANGTATSYDTFEIVYFGSPDCSWCQSWKKEHLPKWRKANISRQIRLTQRSADCIGDSKYTAICQAVFAETSNIPAFALVHRDTGKLLSTGTGIDGFYRVSRQARKWAMHWETRRKTA